MSSDFKTVLTRDPAIADITSDLVYAVKGGAASTTYQPFTATSSSSAVQIYSIQVPSENIAVARDALVASPLQFRINISAVPVGASAIEWGRTCSLQAYPLASIMTTASVTINNASTSINLSDVLPQLLLLNDNRELYRFNGMCPTLPDQEFGVYTDALASNSSPLAGFANKSYDGCLAPRGAHGCVVQIDRYTPAGYQDHSPISAAVTDTWVVSVFTMTTEPLFLSPFIYGNPTHNRAAMIGINNMSFTMNMNALLTRLVSYAGAGTATVTAGVDVGVGGGVWGADPNMFRCANAIAAARLNIRADPAILLRLLSLQPSDAAKVSSRNVVGFFDVPRYLSPSQGAIAAGATPIVNSPSIQLNQLPDYFCIVARKTATSMTVADANAFLTIRSCSVCLNNMSGLLSGSSPQDLWRLSVENGSQQSWTSFSGLATVATADGQSKLVPTTGSMLLISPTQLSLPDTLAPGSLGAFQFQVQLGLYSQFPAAIPNYEICVATINSGILTIQQGTSSYFSGILTADAVKLAKMEPDAALPDRMVGGMLSKGIGMHPRLRGALRGAVTGAMHGAAMSAGAMSAGRARLAGMY